LPDGAVRNQNRFSTALPDANPPEGLALKLCARPGLGRAAAALPRPLVFTNGVFDLLHRGHVECLEAARREGASLLVAVNSDASARQLAKGPGRPLNTAEDRALVLAALEAVSLVVIFDEPTPFAAIAEARPDVYAKGGDYDIETLAETTLVRGWGGRAIALPYRAGRSTTALVRRIGTLCAEES
jgi:rfaE bifunctional protein nucleotidyltransferase chain/domain